METPIRNRNFPERPLSRPPESTTNTNVLDRHGNGPQDPKQDKKIKMKPNIKCTWIAVIAAVAVCMTVSRAGAADNLGHGFVSNVTSSTNCVYSDTNGGGIQFWDIQAGGTYTVTLSGVDDAANTGMDSSMSVIVHNSAGGNICVTATQTAEGEYTFTITLGAQCETMPIEYGTLTCNPQSPNCVPVAGCQGFGLFAQDNVGGVAGGHEGHLRTTIFDGYPSCAKQGDDTTCQANGTPTPPPTGSITVCKYYDNNANGFQDAGEQRSDRLAVLHQSAGWRYSGDGDTAYR